MNKELCTYRNNLMEMLNDIEEQIIADKEVCEGYDHDFLKGLIMGKCIAIKTINREFQKRRF